LGSIARPPKPDATPARIADREDDAVAERVIGRAAIIRFRRDPGVDQVILRNALGRERLEGCGPARGGEPDLEPVENRRAQSPAFEIGARLRCALGLELQPEMPDGGLRRLGELRRTVGLFGGFRVPRGHRHPGVARQEFHRLHEADILGFLHEADDVALRVAAEAVVEPLAVIHMKTGGFFLMERAGRPHVTLGLVGFAAVPHDLAPGHLAQGHAGLQLVEETGRQAHGDNIGPVGAGVQRPPCLECREMTPNWPQPAHALGAVLADVPACRLTRRRVTKVALPGYGAVHPEERRAGQRDAVLSLATAPSLRRVRPPVAELPETSLRIAAIFRPDCAATKRFRSASAE
jgi:hypothetical protein